MNQNDSVQEDVRLVKLIQSGDQAAEDRIYRKYQEKIMRFALLKIGCRKDAEDIYQETMPAVIERIRENKIDNPEKLESYIYQVCRNKINDSLKKRKRQTSTKLENDHPDPDANFEKKIENLDLIEKKLRKLKPLDKELIFEFFYLGMTSDEIAEKHAMSADAVRQRISRALKRLR